MRDVKLVRLSDDGTHLILTHEGTGEEFALRVDDRLRGAVVSDRARQGALPRERQSRLRPKEIQARLRAGESSEEIAAAADVPIERILRYAGPVLAEREYIAEQARRCALRRNGREGPGQILDDAVGKRLDELQVGRDRASWDAWRSADGRWIVAVTFSLNGSEHKATFTYDPLGRVVTTADDIARALVGEPSQPIPGLTPELVPGFSPDDDADGHRGESSGSRPGLRLAPAPAEDFSVDHRPRVPTAPAEPRFGAEAARADTGGGVDERWPGETAHRDHVSLAPDEVPDLDGPRPASGPEPVAARSSAAPSEPARDDVPGESPMAKPVPRRARASAEARRKRIRSSGRRGTVPSWDDILFGGGGNSQK